MISGALYHLVATYSVKNPVWSCSGSATRARPKSQIWKQTQQKHVNNSAAVFTLLPDCLVASTCSYVLSDRLLFRVFCWSHGTMIFTLFNCWISVTAILFSAIAKVLMRRGFFLHSFGKFTHDPSLQHFFQCVIDQQFTISHCSIYFHCCYDVILVLHFSHLLPAIQKFWKLWLKVSDNLLTCGEVIIRVNKKHSWSIHGYTWLPLKPLASNFSFQYPPC